MKPRNILITGLSLFFAIHSCTEYPDPWIPVDACTLSEPTGNASNPYSTLYEDILDDFVEAGLPGISVAIETPEHGWWVGAAGMASLEDETAMLPCHLHHSASMAKTYTAAMIMRLYEDGKLGLDDPASDYLPEDIVSRVANADQATIRQLLNHTSGMDASYNSVMNDIDLFNNPTAESSIESHFERYVYRQSAPAAPGEEFFYRDINYALLGMIVENASGMSIGEYLEQEILDPAGFINTFYRSSPGYPDEIPYTVNSYFEIFPEQLQNCTDMELSTMKAEIGFTGILATPYEYGRFIQELMRGNIVDEGTLELMLEGEKKYTDIIGYGLGIMRYHDINDYPDSYGHTGSGRGSRSIMMYFPDADVTISFGVNLGSGTTFNVTMFNQLVTELVHLTFNGERIVFDE